LRVRQSAAITSRTPHRLSEI